MLAQLDEGRERTRMLIKVLPSSQDFSSRSYSASDWRHSWLVKQVWTQKDWINIGSLYCGTKVLMFWGQKVPYTACGFQNVRWTPHRGAPEQCVGAVDKKKENRLCNVVKSNPSGSEDKCTPNSNVTLFYSRLDLLAQIQVSTPVLMSQALTFAWHLVTFVDTSKRTDLRGLSKKKKVKGMSTGRCHLFSMAPGLRWSALWASVMMGIYAVSCLRV